MEAALQAANVGSNPEKKPANPARDLLSDLPNPNEAATKVTPCLIALNGSHMAGLLPACLDIP